MNSSGVVVTGGGASGSSNKSLACRLEIFSEYAFRWREGVWDLAASFAKDAGIPVICEAVASRYSSITSSASNRSLLGAVKKDIPRELYLGDNQLGPLGCEYLASAWQTSKAFSHLTILDLAYNRLGQSSGSLVANSIGEDGAQHIARILAMEGSLTHLCINNNSIRDSGVKAISNALRMNKTLRKLYLQGNFITDSGAECLFQALKNCNLQVLNISHNKISSSGIGTLCECLKGNVPLTYLDISGNSLATQGAKALASALICNCSLEYLNLGGNNLGDEGAGHILISLQPNTRLRSLTLSHNNTTDGCAILLSELLLHNCTLTCLRLGSNSLSDSSAVKIQEALKINSTVQKLELPSVTDPSILQGIASILEKNTRVIQPTQTSGLPKALPPTSKSEGVITCLEAGKKGIFLQPLFLPEIKSDMYSQPEQLYPATSAPLPPSAPLPVTPVEPVAIVALPVQAPAPPTPPKKTPVVSPVKPVQPLLYPELGTVLRMPEKYTIEQEEEPIAFVTNEIFVNAPPPVPAAPFKQPSQQLPVQRPLTPPPPKCTAPLAPYPSNTNPPLYPVLHPDPAKQVTTALQGKYPSQTQMAPQQPQLKPQPHLQPPPQSQAQPQQGTQPQLPIQPQRPQSYPPQRPSPIPSPPQPLLQPLPQPPQPPQSQPQPPPLHQPQQTTTSHQTNQAQPPVQSQTRLPLQQPPQLQLQANPIQPQMPHVQGVSPPENPFFTGQFPPPQPYSHTQPSLPIQNSQQPIVHQQQHPQALHQQHSFPITKVSQDQQVVVPQPPPAQYPTQGIPNQTYRPHPPYPQQQQQPYYGSQYNVFPYQPQYNTPSMPYETMHFHQYPPQSQPQLGANYPPAFSGPTAYVLSRNVPQSNYDPTPPQPVTYTPTTSTPPNPPQQYQHW
ncbi:NOD3 protein [Pelomyxa schiedti]|nr:NOD3 protein [Pelomyxa schiedti]